LIEIALRHRRDGQEQQKQENNQGSDEARLRRCGLHAKPPSSSGFPEGIFFRKGSIERTRMSSVPPKTDYPRKNSSVNTV
jgi:hypothetical protein